MCCVQLLSGPTNFRSTFIKLYFRPKYTHNIKLKELKVLIKLDKLKAPVKLGKLEVPIKLDKLEVPLPTLEVP